MPIQRLYTFQSGKKASSAQMNAELDQLVGEVNNKITPEDAQIKVDTHENKTNNPHSVTTQQVNVLTSNFKNATDSGDSYPIGLTTFWTDTADWPIGAGLVFTIRLSGYRMHQFFYANQASTVWSRTWYNGAWTTWDQLETIAGAQAKVDAVDSVKINIITSKLSTDAGTAYPLGISTFNPSPSWSILGNTLNGHVVTFVTDKSLRVAQMFFEISGRQFSRFFYNGTWTSWVEAIFDDSATRLSIFVHRDVNYSIAANTLTKMSFNLGPYGRKTEQWASNRFTAPKTGLYAISVSATFDSLSQYGVGELYLYKNGAKWKRLDKVIAPGATNLTAKGSLTNYAVAGDYYEFYVFTSEATALNIDTFATITQITP